LALILPVAFPAQSAQDSDVVFGMTNVYATFADPSSAEKAAGALLDHGVRAEDISIVFPEGYAQREIHTQNEHGQDKVEHGITTTTGADAAAGSAKGVGAGIVIGALAGLAVLFIPGVGLVLGGGALAMALTGAAGTVAAGAVAGGVAGYLKDQGVAEEAVITYCEAIKNGSAMLVLTTPNEKVDEPTIQAIVHKYGGALSMYAPAPIA
jgi:uncharacterized membrane protein